MPVTKSGDLSDTNKWRGVNLIDIGANMFSSMMCNRLFKIIKLHGCPTQFGSSTGVGCQDDCFVIKMAHHGRQKHKLPMYVAFVDLVKAFDTVSHSMILKILERYDALPRFRAMAWRNLGSAPYRSRIFSIIL